MDITTNKVLYESLAMPHSPRVYQKELYLLLYATEELLKVDTTIAKIDCFIRGLSFYRGKQIKKITHFWRPSNSKEKTTNRGSNSRYNNWRKSK